MESDPVGELGLKCTDLLRLVLKTSLQLPPPHLVLILQILYLLRLPSLIRNQLLDFFPLLLRIQHPDSDHLIFIPGQRVIWYKYACAMLDLELDFELEAQVLHGEALLRVDVLQRSIVGRRRAVTGDAERGVERRLGS